MRITCYLRELSNYLFIYISYFLYFQTPLLVNLLSCSIIFVASTNIEVKIINHDPNDSFIMWQSTATQLNCQLHHEVMPGHGS